jgi:predicted alpha/beta-fold hydrolase
MNKKILFTTIFSLTLSINSSALANIKLESSSQCEFLAQSMVLNYISLDYKLGDKLMDKYKHKIAQTVSSYFRQLFEGNMEKNCKTYNFQKNSLKNMTIAFKMFKNHKYDYLLMDATNLLSQQDLRSITDNPPKLSAFHIALKERFN